MSSLANAIFLYFLGYTLLRALFYALSFYMNILLRKIEKFISSNPEVLEFKHLRTPREISRDMTPSPAALIPIFGDIYIIVYMVGVILITYHLSNAVKAAE